MCSLELDMLRIEFQNSMQPQQFELESKYLLEVTAGVDKGRQKAIAEIS